MKTQLRLAPTAVYEASSEGGYTCYFKEFPEIFSEGETISEAKVNLFDALQLVRGYYSDEARKQKKGFAA